MTLPTDATLADIIADIRATRDAELERLRAERDELQRALPARPLKEVLACP